MLFLKREELKSKHTCSWSLSPARKNIFFLKVVMNIDVPKIIINRSLYNVFIQIFINSILLCMALISNF